MFDVRNHLGTIDLEASSLIRALGDQGTLGAVFVPEEILFTPSGAFLNYADLPEAVPGQEPWASARYRQLFGAPQWPDQGTVSALALTTPAHIAGMLQSSRKTLVEIGPQPIRGATATRYSAVVDLAKLPAAAPESTRGVIRTQARALAAALGATELPMDVWIDAKGRPRRVQIDLGAAGGVTTIEVPPEDDAGVVPDSTEEAPADGSGIDGSVLGSATTDPVLEGAPAGEALAPDGTVDPDGLARTLEGNVAVAEQGPPRVVLVIDFITFGGRARAVVPAEDVTGAYADVTRIAQAVAASFAEQP